MLVKSYTAEDRIRCNKAFLDIHQIAFESLGHSTPLGEQMLAELHTAVLCRLCLQKVSFPRTFEASTSQHEEYMAYRARRHEIAKRLQPQQDKDERGIVLQNLKNDQVAKANYRFPEKDMDY